MGGLDQLMTDTDETFRLERLNAYGVLDTPREPAFDRIVFTAAQLMRTPVAQISLVSADRQWFKAQVGFVMAETPRAAAFCSATITSDDVLVVEDATADPRFARNPLVTGPPYIRFYAGAPLITPEGYRVGTLCVLDHRARTVTGTKIAQLQQLARSVVHLLEVHAPTRD